ncbi:DUF1398 family protein [Nemorincola caseinilytica]|uniref:DUF1398 family protein n=1 Tax=Nemorincola caseinilytica TaxID=2054315 RepID=A0ABP8NSN8_9BACT
MFTIDQIKQAHSKVRSGADFPAYIRELKLLGVTRYESYVADGHTDYYGSADHMASSLPKYETLAVADIANAAQFKTDLKTHQQGGTDYPTFCSDSAKGGIEKWIVDLQQMTCTYYDKQGNEVLVEQIPQ